MADKTAVDILLYNASQVLTLEGGPQRGRKLGELGMIEGGAVAINAENHTFWPAANVKGSAGLAG